MNGRRRSGSGRAETVVNAERLRLDEAESGGIPRRRWDPYLSERQWGTVREDYGGGGDTWSYFSGEQVRCRAYRWGEHGLAGVSDDRQQVFDGNRHFDVVIEYAKATPEDLLTQVTVHNQGPEHAELHVLPTLWFRHTWSCAGGAEQQTGAAR
jgi:hypothetical protein